MASVKRARTDRERELVLRAVALLRRVAAATQEWQRSEVREGFTINQALVLHHLVKHGDATPSGLADWMQVSRGTVTPTVQRLEELGLLSRRPDDEDARRQWLRATPAAHAIVAEVEQRVLVPVFATFADWSAPELERFCEGLSRVLASGTFGGGT